jgi:hypothetical protein
VLTATGRWEAQSGIAQHDARASKATENEKNRRSEGKVVVIKDAQIYSKD